MNTEVSRIETHVPQIRPERSLTAVEIKAQVNLIQEVMGAVMKENTHYGTIPGCKQPTLYKAGSETLLSTFRIAVEPEVDDLSTSDEIRYRVRAIGRHQATGIVVGAGVGECSTSEDKYKWRAALCDEEFNDTPADRRRIKYVKKGWNRSENRPLVNKVQQIRTEPADLANTVLKMAKKRAQIDLCLTATAASDIFTQDLEDLPDEYRQTVEAEHAAPRQQPRARTDTSGATVTEGQVRLIHARLKDAGVTADDVCAKFGADDIESLKKAQVNDILAFIESGND